MSQLSSCITQDDNNLTNAIRQAYAQKQNIVSREPYITTITCCFYLNRAPKNIETLSAMVANPCTELITSLIDEVFGGQEKFFPKPQHGVFFNSKIFSMLDDDAEPGKTIKVAIKCFTNGTLHITGARKIYRAYEIAQMFCVLMELVEGGNGNSDMYTIVGHTIQLINIHFNLRMPNEFVKHSLHLQRLHDMLQEESVQTNYNNDRHSGVNVKYLTSNMTYVTILIFESGNVLMCGVKSIVDYTEAFNFLTMFIEQKSDKLYIATNDILGKKAKGKQQKGNQHFDYGKYLLLK